MSIVIIRQDGKAADWKKALKEYNTDLEVFTHLEPHDKKRVKMALVWKHPKGALQAYPNLRYIASNGAGVDFIFEDSTIDKSIPVTRVVDHQLAIDMSEYVIAILFTYLKNLQAYKVDQTKKLWEPKPYKRIQDVRVGILGLGKLGAQLGHDLVRIGFNVHSWSSSKKEVKGIFSYAGPEQLKDFLKISKVLVCLLPLTESTRGILNKQLFDQLPRGAFVVNAARGGHLVDKDLLAALDSQQLSGAALDVYHEEPLPKDHLFWEHPKVLMTPHYASVSDTSSVVPQIIENYQRMEAGQPLLYEVSKNRGY